MKKTKTLKKTKLFLVKKKNNNKGSKEDFYNTNSFTKSKQQDMNSPSDKYKKKHAFSRLHYKQMNSKCK